MDEGDHVRWVALEIRSTRVLGASKTTTLRAASACMVATPDSLVVVLHADGPDGKVYATARALFVAPKPQRLLMDVAKYLMQRAREALPGWGGAREAQP